MKNKNLYAIVALVLTYSVVLTSGCGPATTTNGNLARNENAATSSVNTNVASESALLDSACNENNINQKLDKVKAAVAQKIASKPKLQEQITNGLFKYSIQIGPGTPGASLDMYLEGGIGGKDNFYDMVKIIREFFKGSCTSRVYFVQAGTIRSTGTALPLTGDEFEWFACEEGTQPCPGGTCRPQCLVSPSPGANANANSNTNAPGKSNTNSNANRKTGN